MRIVFIGAGNLATHLSLAMHKAGLSIIQIFSRTEKNASALANQLQTNWTSDIHAIVDDADFYIFSLKDDALESVIHKIPKNKGCWIHTAGSVPLHIFKNYTDRYGVLYPLQTFSKHRSIDFSSVPCFIEGNCSQVEASLYRIASSISTHVKILSSEKRKYLHLAAVFACNFTNHMYTIASHILEEQHIPFATLLPLIDETAAKVHLMTPLEAQTGPAVRYDQQIIEKHLTLLENPDMKNIYLNLSNHIHKTSSHE